MIFIQEHYILSRLCIILRNIYSFKFKVICSFNEKLYSLNIVAFRGHSRNICSKIVPSHFMIIINFTITIHTSFSAAPRGAFQQPVYNKCKVRWLRVSARPLQAVHNGETLSFDLS